MSLRLGLLATGVALAVNGGGALAQTPSRIVPSERPDQGRAPAPATAAPKTSTAAPVPPLAPFLLREIRVEGSTLAADAIAAATRPYVGRTLGEAGLQAVADALADAYARSDLALYTILVPQQDFAGGVLRLVAVEGHIDALEVAGARPGADMALVQAYGRKLQSERPLTRPTLERYVSLIRDVPGLAPQISLGETNAAGATQLQVRTDDRRARAAVAVNNRGTRFLGSTQVQVDADLYSALRQGDQTRLTLAFPTDFDLFQYAALSHAQPVGSEGMVAQVSAGYLRTRPETIPLEGKATSLGLTVSYPVIRSYTRSLYLSGGLDGLDSDNALLGVTISDERTRTLRGLATYTFAGRRQALNINGGGSLGLDVLGARVSTGGLSQAEFGKLNARISYDLELMPRLIARGRAAAQHSDDLLPASEQFALGGEAFGRAYESAFVAGDSGYAGLLELAFRLANADTFRGSEVYGFADRGQVTYNARLGQPSVDADVASIGGGVRVLFNERVQLGLEGARGLENPLPLVDRKDWRLVVDLKSIF